MLTSDGVDVWKLSDKTAFYFASGMTIDADGSPRAYNPDNTGLDDLKNAQGEDGWVGIQVQDGKPVIQGPNDPAPGYYVSKTALEDRTKRETDPARFVDSEKIPFIVLPWDVARQTSARVGDFAVIENLRNGRVSPAIYADIGPRLGEGSIALARALQINRTLATEGPIEECSSLFFRVRATIGRVQSKRSKASPSACWMAAAALRRSANASRIRNSSQ